MAITKEELNELSKEELIKKILELEESNDNISGKFGLIWDREKEPEKIVLECDKNIPVLKSISEKDINTNSGTNHILIEGDNFHSLSILNYTHQEKIDVIYIDPPYNTGNKDFIYNDKIVDVEDGYRHSKWLNFMEKRLKLARRLLKESGVIFISIDDNELTQLKMLCNIIFGEGAFLSCIPRRTKSSGKTTNSISQNHDYVLVYCKNKEFVNIKSLEHTDPGFKYSDEYEATRGKYKLNQTLDYNSLAYSTSLDYPIEIDGEILYPGQSKEKWEERQKGNHKRADWAWRWSKDLYEFGLKNGFIVVKKSKNGTRIYTKTYMNAKIEKTSNGYEIVNITRSKPLSTLDFMDSIYSNDNAKKDLNKLFSEPVFDYPKPVELIKKIISIYGGEDPIILDFFAGSGTTGQAVLELNNEDGGNRQFILCTNNENNICEKVTYPRLEKVISGYGNKKSLKGNLKYFRTDFVENTSNRDQLKYDLTEKCIPMLYLKENTFELVKSTEEYQIYSNMDKSKYTCVYFEMFGSKYNEFIKEIESIDKPKSLYIFSLSDFVDQEMLNNVKKYTIEPIPYKIIDLYKKIVRLSKEN